MKYYYEGHDKFGQIVHDSIEAESEEKAAQAIRNERKHYAREISPDPVKPKYEKPAIGVMEEAATGEEAPKEAPEETPEETPEPSVEAPEAKKPVCGKHGGHHCRSQATPGEPGEALKRDLEGISVVMRQMSAWNKDYKRAAAWLDAAKEAEERGEEPPPGSGKLPPGVPRVGGKTWEFFESHLEDIGVELVKEAMRRAAFGS
jgi:hypothetical protein